MSTLRQIMTIWAMMTTMIKTDSDRNQVMEAYRRDTPGRCTDKTTEMNQITVKGTIMWTRTGSELRKI